MCGFGCRSSDVWVVESWPEGGGLRWFSKEALFTWMLIWLESEKEDWKREEEVLSFEGSVKVEAEKMI